MTNNSIINSGDYLTNAQLTHKYGAIGNEYWDKLKHAITNLGWHDALKQGNQNYCDGEFVATTVYNSQNIQVVGNVYKVHSNGTQLQWFESEDSMLANTFEIGSWGRRGYPSRKQVRGVAVYSDSANTYTCIGFIFSHISGLDKNADWKCQHNFGLYPTYISKYGSAGEFKKTSKLWRLGGRHINDGITAWNYATTVTVERDKVFLILRHARIPARANTVFLEALFE